MNKILLSSLLAATAAMPAIAGVDNLNYQAVLKNGAEVLKNEQVEMKFELLDNAQTVVWSQEQAPTTNDAGLVVCQLGDDNLTTLEWGDLSLRVSINLGNGYEVISNEPVSSVPTAMYALRSADTDEVKAAVEELLQKDYDEKFLQITADLETVNGFIDEQDAYNQQVSDALEKLVGLDAAEIDDFNQRISDEVARLGEEVENLNSDPESILALRNQISELQGKTTETNEAVEELMQDVELHKETILGINAEIVKLNDFVDDADVNLQDINDELSKLQGLNYEEINDFHERVSDELIRLGEEVENLNSDPEAILALRNQISELQGKTTETNEAIDNLEELTGESGRIMTLIKENQNNITAFNDAIDNLEELTGETGRIMTLIKENQNNITTNKESIDNLEELTGEQGRIMNLIKQLQNDMAANNDAIDNLEDLTGEGSRIMQLIKELQNNTAAIEEAVAEMVEKDYDEKFLQITADLTRVDGVIEDIDIFNQDLVEKLEPMMGLNAAEVDDQFDRLHTEVISLNEFKESVETNLQDINDELSKLQGLSYEEVNDFHERVSEALTNLNEAQDEQDVYNQAVSDALAKLVGLDAEEIDDFNDRVSAELTRLAEEQEALKTDVDANTEVVVKFRSDINQLQSVSNENKEALEQLVLDNEENKTDIKNMKADIAQIEGLAEKIEALEAKVAQLEAKIATLEGNN